MLVFLWEIFIFSLNHWVDDMKCIALINHLMLRLFTFLPVSILAVNNLTQKNQRALPNDTYFQW